MWPMLAALLFGLLAKPTAAAPTALSAHATYQIGETFHHGYDHFTITSRDDFGASVNTVYHATSKAGVDYFVKCAHGYSYADPNHYLAPMIVKATELAGHLVGLTDKGCMLMSKVEGIPLQAYLKKTSCCNPSALKGKQSAIRTAIDEWISAKMSSAGFSLARLTTLLFRVSHPLTKQDIHGDNVFVNPNTGVVTAVIDWSLQVRKGRRNEFNEEMWKVQCDYVGLTRRNVMCAAGGKKAKTNSKPAKPTPSSVGVKKNKSKQAAQPAQKPKQRC
ncbi:hypothetical protein DFJ73DRAFT_768212 [Zopfochytrium polystomum]|nr:hypothetical protein DFJ73DRAFT_768212 [Zopfochytrium polystomum]